MGTVSVTTLTQLNRTSTITNTYYNEDVPRFYTLYQQAVDEAGTKIVEATITIKDEVVATTFAYPTPWVDYPAAYHWEGILPTTDEKSGQICATSAEELAFGEVTPHPLYPQPTDVIVDKRDPEGSNYVPVWIALQELPEKGWFDQAFPSESAFAYCTSVAGKPAPVDISTAKFVLATNSINTSLERPGIVHQESTATGWEETTTTKPPSVFEPSQQRGSTHIESTATRPALRESITAGPSSTSIQVPDIPVIVSSAVPWDTRPSAKPSGPLAHFTSTRGEQQAPSLGDGGGFPAPTPGSGNGQGQPRPSNTNAITQFVPIVGNPQDRPAPNPATPIFTFVPTTINGRPTATPVFILPGSSSTASIGQTVTVNGQATILAAPTAIFAFVPTTINGVATSAPGFIISGTSTATIGQTVTLDGQPTVLEAPAPFETEIPTTIFGIETHITAFIISGSITAFPGQTVTLDGQVTALPTADAVFTLITTTGIDGKQTVVPAYIISGSTTATIGQTVTIGGTATVLSTPTADALFTSVTTTINGKATVIPVYIISGSTTATIGQTVTLHGTATVLSWPSATGTEASAGADLTSFGGQPQETGSKKGIGLRDLSVQWHAMLFVAGAFIVFIL